MATINFNANEVEPSSSFDAIPAGKYQAVITDSEFRPNRAGTGEYLHVGMSCKTNTSRRHRNAGQKTVAKDAF